MKTYLAVIVLCFFSAQATAGWSCTMPNGVVIFNLLSPCPPDSIKAEQRETALPSPVPASKKNTVVPETDLPRISAAPDTPQIRQPMGSLIGQPKGYINNDNGAACWYTQTAERGLYFHSIPGNKATLTFDDPRCMRDSGLGLDVNKMMINHVIVRPYSHADAAFKSKPSEMYKTSALQVRGSCIQSSRYPIIGVVIEYMVAESSIYQVRHAASVGRCSNTPITTVW